MESVQLFFDTFVELFAEMAPFLLLGFLLAGVLHVWVPQSLYVPKISKPNFKSVLLSALFGIPLPICSCGVIPTAVALRKEGASKGSSVSFLIATPATGVDSILATYSLLGLPFAILRPAAAFVTSLFGGMLTNIFTKGEAKEDLSKIDSMDGACSCGKHCCEHQNAEAEHCCCGHQEPPAEKSCCSGHQEAPAEKSCCCCHDHHVEKSVAPVSFTQKIKKTLEYGYGDLLVEISKWLLIGLVLGALIAAFVPNEIFMYLRDYPVLCMVGVLLISMPMYTCSTGSIPLALALMAKGLPPGAALVLLMAGPATSIASMVVVGKTFGKRTLIAYLVSIAFGAFAFGFVVDHFMMDTFAGHLVTDICHGSADSLSIFDYACAAILAGLILFGFLPRKRKASCCCGK